MKNPSGSSRKAKPKPKKPLGPGPSVAKKASSSELLTRLEEINHLIENSPVVLFKWKAAPGWPVEFVTQNVAQFGYTAESFLSGERSYASIVFPEDLERIAKEVNEYSASGFDKFYQEYRILAGDGSVRWIDDHTIVQRDSKGKIRFYEGIIVDSTERKKAEDALRFTQFAVAHMSDQAVWLTPDGHHFYVNDAACRAMEYSREELLKTTVFDIVPEMTPEIFKLHWQELREKGSFTLETYNKSKSGRVYPVEVRANFVIFDGKEYNCASVTDISERKKAEQLLSYSISLTNAALESTADGILIVARDGKIARWNQKFLDLFHVPQHLLDTKIKDPVLDYVVGLMMNPEAFLAKVLELYEHPEVTSIDMLYLTDGRIFERYSQPQKIAEEIVGRFWSFRDVTARMRSEEALSALNRKNEEALRVAHMGHWEFDIATGEFLFNDQYYSLHGMTAEEAGGYSMSAEAFAKTLVSPESSHLVGESIQAAINSDDPNFEYQTEARIVRKDGTLRDVVVWFRVEKDITKKTIRLHGVNQDITERKKAEEALRESEYFLNKSQEVAQIGSYKLDIASGTWISSPSLDRIFGIDQTFPRTVEGWLSILSAPDREMIADHLLNHVIKHRNRFDRDYRIVRHDTKEERWVYGLGELEYDMQGNAVRMIGTIQDITERKKIEEMTLFLAQRPWAAAGEDFFSSLAAQIAKILSVEYVFIGALKEGRDAISTLIFYGDGKVLPNIEYDLNNGPCEQVVGQILRIFPSGLRTLFPRTALLQKVGAEGYAGIPLWDSRGRAIGLLSVMSRKPLQNEQLLTDLLQMVAVRAAGELESKRFEEAQAKLQEQLSQAQKMESVGLLAGGVAHDFNNLLTPILGYTELMRMNLPEGDPDREKLQNIMQSAERAKDLTKRLLAFSRKQILDLKIADLGDIVRQFEGVLNRTIRENIHIRVAIAPFHGLVKADKGQIEQVLLNLAVNAQDAMPNGGTLEIAVDDIELDASYAEVHPEVGPGRYVMLSVRDTGMGMDAETQEHIFEPFFTSKELGKGTGLGLSTVYGIVKQHGGSILVYSEKGNGSIFKIFLPKVAACADVGEEQPTEQSELLRGSETILVVEDNETVRVLTCRMLESLGYTVIEAQDVDACFALMKKQKSEIDLLLTDVVMPRMNGKELFTHLQSDHPKLKVLYMSGYTRDVIGRDGILEDTVHFIQKPFSVNAMARKIREALGK